MTDRPYHDVTPNLPDDDDQVMAIAERVCTPKELEVLALVRVKIGRRRGARMLGISESAWRSRIDNAIRKITNAQRKAA